MVDFFHQPLLVMHSCVELLSTNLKVVTTECFKKLKWIRKCIFECNFEKFQEAKTFTQYLKFKTRHDLFEIPNTYFLREILHKFFV